MHLQRFQIVVLILALVAVAGKATAAEPIQGHLIQLERASWDLAIKRKAADYRMLHAPDYVTVSADGVSGRAASEAVALDPNVVFDHWNLSHFRATAISPDVILLTYHVAASMHVRGKPMTVSSYASSVWAKRGGIWLNVFYQATPASA